MQAINEDERAIIKIITVLVSELTPTQMITFKRETAEAFKGDDKALNAVDAIISVADSLRKRRALKRAQTPADV